MTKNQTFLGSRKYGGAWFYGHEARPGKSKANEPKGKSLEQRQEVFGPCANILGTDSFSVNA